MSGDDKIIGVRSVQKIGFSLFVCLPYEVVKMYEIRKGDKILFRMKNGKVYLEVLR